MSHCVVPAGGPSFETHSPGVTHPTPFFFRQVSGVCFAAQFCWRLSTRLPNGRAGFPRGSNPRSAEDFLIGLRTLSEEDWVVYSKLPSFASTFTPDIWGAIPSRGPLQPPLGSLCDSSPFRWRTPLPQRTTLLTRSLDECLRASCCTSALRFRGIRHFVFLPPSTACPTLHSVSLLGQHHNAQPA